MVTEESGSPLMQRSSRLAKFAWQTWAQSLEDDRGTHVMDIAVVKESIFSIGVACSKVNLVYNLTLSRKISTHSNPYVFVGDLVV